MFSIRNKIIALSIISSLFILIILFVSINILYSKSLENSIDRLLVNNVELIIHNLRFDANGRLLKFSSDGSAGTYTSRRDLHYFIWDARSLLPLRRSTSMMQVEIPRRLLDDPEKRKFQEFSFAAKKYRIYTTFYPPEVNTNRQLIILQTLESMSEYQKDLERLRTLFYYITPLSTVLIILASWLIAHRTLKPIDILIKSVSDIDPLSLDQRVPVQTRDEVGQLGRSFNALLKRVDNAFQLLKRFTADASHELRTPLTSMRTRVELALNKTRDTEYYKSVLSEVLEDLHHLNKISDSLLFLSRGDARLIDTQFSSQDISDIVNDWIESISPLAEEKHITIEKNVEGGIKGSIDRTTFDSIVLNLLDNAIKYTNQNGNISIQLYLLGKSIHLTICNSGALISPADAEHIFERFVRLQQTRHSVRGTGLGLAIVKMAVQHHGGQIDVSVNDKNQNCFHVTIPDKSAN